MRAAVLHGPADLRIEAVAVPEPGPGQLLAEVSHCGICGTDLHMVLDGWGRPGSVGGHEWSGRVVKSGPEVAGFACGDEVVGGPSPACGACPPCRARRPSLCDARATPGTEMPRGAFADYVLVDADAAVAVPQGLDLRTAARAEPLAVALHAITQAGASPGGRVLVSGAGPIGMLVVAALAARGVDDIVVSEPSGGRRALAERLGAATVTPDALDVPTMAEPRRLVADPVDVALECSGRAGAIGAALAQLIRGGRLVLVGTGIEPLALDPNRILLNELEITGAFEYDAGGVEEAVALLASGRVDVDALTEPGDVDLDGALAAMEGLAGGDITGKVLVRPRPPEPDRDQPREAHP